jgi:site-specific recombinase XerD
MWKATGRTAEAAKTNAIVDSTKAAIFKLYREMQERENYVTAERIRNVFLGIEQKHQTLLELFDRHNGERELLIGVNISKSAHERYCVTRRHIAGFIRYKYNLSDIPVKEVNHNFIADFEVYLVSQHNYSKNYIVSILKKLRHIIEVAINSDLIYQNPFRQYKLQWQVVDRGYLTQDEVEMIMNYQFEDKRLEKDRDVFVFCCFTGLAYVDVKNLTSAQIQESFDGKLWIKGKRRKTDTEYNIPLLNIPKMILEKYNWKTASNFILPVSYITNYNDKLKKIAVQTGISKKMSSHLARHTFATLTLTKGVSIESVSKMLGHTNIRTTQVYARITDKKISNDMEMLAGKLQSIETKFTVNF